jgi:hypothetical protein
MGWLHPTTRKIQKQMEKAEEVTPLFCLPRALANFKERSADRMNEQKKDFLFRRSSRQQCTFGVLPATSIRNNIRVGRG